ncbi:F-box only protein 44-like isoform X1 [Acipenser ruthenus]|uniref:F-box only protein 44-like isoform X1 n=1 Tax=Acipenser ruthenus TaxID=7906 RepID=UPI002740DB7F|nr:F-box only protein 44-like isoform X1 [Acipenser ruthenus]XP_058849465.1 F-box only protein 44-like isoform X1 [Acipenser ruthenus]XP_058849466.1 F-box only protein 44-like isoform X1 [Acipenser ruthenus]
MGQSQAKKESYVRKPEGTPGSMQSRFSEVSVFLLEEILVQVPATDLVHRCRLVSSLWRDVVDSASLWKRKCKREGLRPRDPTFSPVDWRLFYFLSQWRRNLLSNPRAEEGFNNWTLCSNGGDKWKIESIEPEHALPDDTVQKYFVTSYSPCMKSQIVDLRKEGYSVRMLDEIRPDIVCSDWYAPRWDCGSKYEVCIQLLSAKHKVIQQFEPEPVIFLQWNDMEWKEMTHVFSGYGRGVRFVKFSHGGSDTQFWAGWYGIRVTNSSVVVEAERRARQ